MSSHPAPVVLFDVDGTLTDTNHLHTLAWRRAFLDHGFDVACWRIHGLIGAAGSRLMTECIGAPDDDVKQAWRQHFLSLTDDVRAFRGARQLIEHVSASGARAVLATASPPDLLEFHLDALGMGTEDFAAVTTDDDVEEGKPAPDTFIAAHQAAGGRDSPAIVVGDTGWDLDAARDAGLPAIAVLSGGWPADELVARGALEVHEDVEALLADVDHSALGDLLRRRD